MPNKLYEYRKNVTSQYGEDGILERIFELLNVKTGWCVDVGASTVHNSNTYSLMKKGWSGVFIDVERLDKLRNVYHDKIAYFLNTYVEPSGRNRLDILLEETSIPKEFELLSIDIDGNDYYVWESLHFYLPTIVLVEFNPCIKLNDYVQPPDGKGGSSLSSLTKLGKSKGYELIATTEINAFYARKDFAPAFEIEDNSVESMFIETDKGYGRDKTDYSK